MYHRNIAPLLVLSGIFCAPVAAQSNRPAPPQGNSTFVDGLLRTLVDSRMNVDRAPVPGSTSPLPASADLRRLMDAFTSEASRLSTNLQNETRYDPNIRSLLGDAVRLRATLDVVSRRIQSGADASLLQGDFAALDQQWRALSHYIKQLPSASSNVQRSVTNLDGIHAELSKALQVGPQMQRTELVQMFSALTSDLDHLAEDIQLDLYSHPQRDAWSNAVQGLRSRADQLRSLVGSEYPYRDVVRYYKQFYDAWLPVKRDLREVDNRYIQRNLNRITQNNDRLHSLLWLTPIIDGRDVLHLAELLHRNVETVSDQISLQQLLVLDNAAEVFKRAREFYTHSNEFRRIVAQESNLENIRWDFRSLDTAWFDLKSLLTPIQDPRTIQKIALVEGSLAELRTGLGLQTTFDQRQVMELASQLDNMSDLLAYDIQRFIGRSNQYPPQVRDDAISISENLRRVARDLNLSLTQNSDAPAVKRQIQQLSQEWQRLQGVISRFNEADRARIARSYQEIAPAMTKLQVLYTL